MSVNFYLVRHGQSMGNIQNVYLGRTDWDLSELGHRQAQCLVSYFDGINIDKIYSSPLRRAYNTAMPVARAKNMDIHICGGIVEIDAGDWDRMDFDTIMRDNRELWDKWIESKSGVTGTPNGETVGQVQKRAVAAIEKLCCENDGKDLLIVSHAVVCRTFLCHVLGKDISELYKVDYLGNAAISMIRYDNGKFTLLYNDDRKHLGELATDLSAFM